MKHAERGSSSLAPLYPFRAVAQPRPLHEVPFSINIFGVHHSILPGLSSDPETDPEHRAESHRPGHHQSASLCTCVPGLSKRSRPQAAFILYSGVVAQSSVVCPILVSALPIRTIIPARPIDRVSGRHSTSYLSLSRSFCQGLGLCMHVVGTQELTFFNNHTC